MAISRLHIVLFYFPHHRHRETREREVSNSVTRELVGAWLVTDSSHCTSRLPPTQPPSPRGYVPIPTVNLDARPVSGPDRARGKLASGCFMAATRGERERCIGSCLWVWRDARYSGLGFWSVMKLFFWDFYFTMDRVLLLHCNGQAVMVFKAARAWLCPSVCTYRTIADPQARSSKESEYNAMSPDDDDNDDKQTLRRNFYFLFFAFTPQSHESPPQEMPA